METGRWLCKRAWCYGEFSRLLKGACCSGSVAVKALAGSSREPAVVDLAVRALVGSPIPVPVCKRTFHIKV